MGLRLEEGYCTQKNAAPEKCAWDGGNKAQKRVFAGVEMVGSRWREAATERKGKTGKGRGV